MIEDKEKIIDLTYEIENMKNLKELIDKDFQLFCFALNINQGDGSPVRAVAFLNGGDD